jgi:hypothetical protein
MREGRHKGQYRGPTPRKDVQINGKTIVKRFRPDVHCDCYEQAPFKPMIKNLSYLRVFNEFRMNVYPTCEKKGRYNKDLKIKECKLRVEKDMKDNSCYVGNCPIASINVGEGMGTVLEAKKLREEFGLERPPRRYENPESMF